VHHQLDNEGMTALDFVPIILLVTLAESSAASRCVSPGRGVVQIGRPVALDRVGGSAARA
jgi:hypothetical protein